MPFEKFTAVGGSHSSKVSIRSNGQIGLSQGLLRKRGLDSGDWAIVLFYDRDTNRVALQPTKDTAAEGAIKLLRREVTAKDGKTSISAQVSARSFLEFYGISYRKETLSYDPTWDASNNMIVIDLNSPRQNNKEDDA